MTRWLAEANEALVRRDRPPRYKPRSSERRPDYFERRPAPEWADNFLLGRRNGSVEREDDSSDVMPLKEFVEKFSLPRVVKIEGDDRPVLLYRVLEAHRRVEAVPLSGKKGKLVGKPLFIPDSYDGWFSACGCRGGALASPRGSIAALLRARAFALVSPRAISAYRARPASGAQYERAAARPGTPLRLAGVFADGSKAKAPKYAQLIDPQGIELFVPINTKGEMYEVCPEELSPAEWEPAGEGAAAGGAEGAAAAGRAHRLPHLLALWRLPARVRLLAGSVPIEMAHDVGDDLLLRSAVTEPVLVMCSLPEYGALSSSPSKQVVDPRYHAKEALQLLPLNGNIRVRRTQLGFDSEKRMFLSARLQKALTFCQLNVDNWIRQISYANSAVGKSKTAEEIIKDHEPVKFEKEKKFTLQGLKIDPSRLFGKSDKVLKDIPDETEGSIIFLSKNELEHMNYDVQSEEEGKDDKHEEKEDQFAGEKIIIREDGHKKSKWFKNLKLLKSSEKISDDKITAIEINDKGKDIKDPFDPLGEKHSSIERYQDMAKLIEDKFGAARKSDGTTEKTHSYKSLTTSSSDMGTSHCSSNPKPIKKPVLTKSVSVQTGMPDNSYIGDDNSINVKHVRKNLSVDQINYCGSMESDASSGRKMKSFDENMLKKSSATKSSSYLEKRQRIQPDLIPEKAIVKSESYNQIQSCEEINMFGVGSIYNDSDFEINCKQHSFITEKLCSEFHVKTKRVLSKSTSNLLHPKKLTEKKEGSNSHSMPTKTERSDADKVNFRKKIAKPRAPTPNSENDDDIIEDKEDLQSRVRRSISAIQKRKLPVIEDLPYGQVADAVEIEEEKIESDASSDNIYAEICTPQGDIHKTEEEYDNNIDILANDPVICNVKKEVIIRNDERARQMIENQDNPFRHIEVVVIEKTTDFDLDNSSISSSEAEDLGSKNDVSIIDSWERNKDNKIHAIRLEITSNLDDYPEETKSIDVCLSKDALSFSNSIQLNGSYSNEAIYDTLK